VTDHTSDERLERAVLGSVLSAKTPEESKTLFATVTEHCHTPLVWSDRNCRYVAMVMYDRWTAGKPVDSHGVEDALKAISMSQAADRLRELEGKKAWAFKEDAGLAVENSLLMGIGGFSWFSGLCCAYVGASGLGKNAQSLAEYYRLRQAVDIIRAVGTSLLGPSGRKDARKLVDGMMNDLNAVVNGRSGARTVGEVADEVLAAHDAVAGVLTAPAPQWPSATMNKMCGMRGGRLIVLAAPTGCGKTSLALQTAVETAKAIPGPATVGFVSREMRAEDLTRTIIGRDIGVDRELIERGGLNPEQRMRAGIAADRVKRGQGIVILDSRGMAKCSASDVCAWARQQHVRTQGKFALLVVDHLHLLDGDPRASEYERVSGGSRALKCLALELGITVLLLCQLNRASLKPDGRVETRYGAEDFELSALKGSGNIENDADVVIFLCAQGPKDQDIVPIKIKIAKNRWGSLGAIDADFMKSAGQVFRPRVQSRTQSKGMPATVSDSEDLFS